MMKEEKPPLTAEEPLILTELGEQELRGSKTSISSVDVALLVLVDGKSTVAELSRRVGGLSAGNALAAFTRMLEAGLVRKPEQREMDAVDFGLDFGLPAPSPSPGDAHEADQGASSLKTTGYYVRIARRAAGRRPPPADRKPVVLVVEDEPALGKLLRQFLLFEGFEPRVAANRDEILAELRRPPLPDLVLLDVVLPDADGFDILHKMRQHPALKAVPVIMLTAQATREAVLKGLAGGADGYVTKPFEVDVLIKAVRSVLGLASA